MSATSNDARPRLPIKAADPYGQRVPSNTDKPRGEQFAQLIRSARVAAGISQDALADRAGVNRSTVIRWESGDAARPDPEQVRRVCAALSIDPRRAAVALGFLTAEEVEGRPLPLDPQIEEILALLPTLPEAERRVWMDYLKFLHDRAEQRRAG